MDKNGIDLFCPFCYKLAQYHKISVKKFGGGGKFFVTCER